MAKELFGREIVISRKDNVLLDSISQLKSMLGCCEFKQFRKGSMWSRDLNKINKSSTYRL